MNINEFQKFVLDQKSTPPERYDNEYFNKDWRSGGNNYAIKTRRLIEGKNPLLIKEVFKPKKVLDLGCGPGALMLFLNEIGVECEGVDGSPHVIEMAPPEVREKISVAVATECGKPSESYDLVISREVMEHLTVLEVRRAVSEMCRVSSQFVYLTTRYHPNPATILDVTTDFETDPTHITCMSKDLMRMLFVLEGFCSRPDLEEKMDWQQKGRVMVFEKRKK